MRHTPFVIYFTTSILPMTKVTNLFISMKKLSKLAEVDSEMQLREVIESFLIKRTISLLWPLMKKCHKSNLAVPFTGWHTANGSTMPHFRTPAHKRCVKFDSRIRNISDKLISLAEQSDLSFFSHTWWPLMSNCFQHQNVQGNIPDPTAIAFLHLTALIAFIHTVLPERGK